jgi:asparagine synthase (glutamine-hydrolysing)
MCGIAGLWTRGLLGPEAPDDLDSMLAALHHRGPDGRGRFHDASVALGHTRLAIIDLAGGAQPMGNEDASIRVTFNGEIFNYRALRRELQERGHRFATQSDTEVIVHLYEEHGEAFVERLSGQFALALWDAPRRRLVLARDRAGIRPLFYTWVNGRLAFASEVKALFALPGTPRRIDVEGLAGVFALWAPIAPTTVFEGIEALPPAHRMVIGDEGVRVERYWDWPFGEPAAAADPSATASDEDRAEELHALLVDAVRQQLQSDVPVAAYLSGGIDSSAITALIARYSDTPLQTFSLTFEDAEFDESAHQLAMARHLGTTHRPVPCRKADIGREFARAVRHTEVPLVRTAAVPMMKLADAVRAAGFKVVLTGEGADEVFAGYDLFKEARVRRFIAAQPQSAWRSRILARLYPWMAHSPGRAGALAQPFLAGGDAAEVNAPWTSHLARIRSTQRTAAFFSPALRARIEGWDAKAALAGLLPEGSANWPPLARDQYLEATTLMSGYLLSSQGDRVAMAASIEARFPFLDERVMAFGAALPPRLKLRGLREKVLLRRAMRSEVPAAILERHKQPYRAPDSASFFDPQSGAPLPYVAELLSEPRLADAGLFDAASVARLVAKCRAGRAIGFADNMAFVGVLSTMLVHEQFVRGHEVG